VRAPQAAAAPNNAIKTIPTNRSETALLLQPWSTAVSQTKKTMIASTANPFSSIITSPW